MTTSQDNEIQDPDLELKAAIAHDKRWFGVGIGGFLVVLVTVGIVGYFQQVSESTLRSNELRSGAAASQQVSAPVESVKPVEIEQQSYSVNILNGSGVTGAAGKAGEALKSQAQDLELEISTGNASAQTGTTIKYQTDQLKRSRLANELNELYPGAKLSVDETLEYSVEIIIGK